MKLKSIIASISTALFILGFSATGFAGQNSDQREPAATTTSFPAVISISVDK